MQLTCQLCSSIKCTKTNDSCDEQRHCTCCPYISQTATYKGRKGALATTAITTRPHTPAQRAAASNLLLAGGPMVEQVLDLAAVAAAAVGVLAVAGVHQQQHAALDLLLLVPPLLVAQADVGLVNLPCLGLRHKLLKVTAPVTDVWCGLVNSLSLSLLRDRSSLCQLLTQAAAAA